VSATTVGSGRPVTVIEGQLRYLDESHMPDAERSVVTMADAVACGPMPVVYPLAAVAAPAAEPFAGRRSRGPLFVRWARRALFPLIQEIPHV
jgi:hypothetical protein